MKATLFAVVLLWFAMPIPALAVEKSTQTMQPRKPQVIINLNKADVSTLTHSFKGIGKRRAEAIVDYREKHGDYRSVADLANVRGLHAFVNKNLFKLQQAFAVG